MILRKRLLVLFLILLFQLSNKFAFASVDTSEWINTTALPAKIASHTIFEKNNGLIIAGGANTNVYNLNISSTILQNAGLSSWVSSQTPAPYIFWQAGAQKDKYVYLIGGADNGINYISTVYFGEINGSGIVTSWNQTTSLPKKLAIAGASVVGNRIYVSGGFSDQGVNQNIYYSEIQPDGSLSNWILAGNLPQPIFGHGFFEYNGYLYVIGGRNLNEGNLNGVYRQKILDNGNISFAEPLTSLPTGLSRGGSRLLGKDLYIVGGDTNNGTTDLILLNSINSDGTLNNWKESSQRLPLKLCCGALANIGDYLYYTGGHDGVSYFDTVYVSKIIRDESNVTVLSVPLLKQTAEPWQSQIYDSANLWSPQTPTINRWGCAITSAAMVLNYNGITKISSSEPLNPGTLNTWLKSQPDGYVRNGLVNWLAISRLTKTLKPLNPSFAYDALEYKRVVGNDHDQVETDIKNGIPDILQLPGHFVVAKGISDKSILINDTYYNRSDLTGYNDTFQSIGRYVPSNTDLSYIMLTADEKIFLTLRKKNGTLDNQPSFTLPITDPETGSSSGEILATLYTQQPETGDYEIVISANEPMPYTLDTYLYDKNGNVKKITLTGNYTNGEIVYPLTYSKESVSDSVIKQSFTFTDMYKDIKMLFDSKKINTITYLLLNAAVKDIESDYKKGKVTLAVKKIDLFRQVITALSKKDASDPVKQLLLKDLDSLRRYVLGQ